VPVHHRLSPAKLKERKKQFALSRNHYAINTYWEESQGAGVKVAVLDTGIRRDHPDLKEAIANPASAIVDFFKEEEACPPGDDLHGHGTHCAGIIAARAKKPFQFTGIAPACQLLIGKVANRDGDSSGLRIAKGIDWAVKRGADIISISHGVSSLSTELFRAVHMALAKGVCIIVAAGNNGSIARNNLTYPARLGSVIAVAAHDRKGNVLGFSSRGGEVDFMAPGENIWSTCFQDNRNGYAPKSGTSMAAPFIAGMAALIIGSHKRKERKDGAITTPIRNCDDLREHLLRIAAHPGFHDNARGYGPLTYFDSTAD